MVWAPIVVYFFSRAALEVFGSELSKARGITAAE